MKERSFTLLTKPLIANHKHFAFRGRLILTKKWRNTKESMCDEITSLWGNFAPIKGIVTLNLSLYYGDNRKRDIDAYLKMLLDSMTGIVYEDDSQIDELHVFKFKDKENPRTEIIVGER